MYGIGAATARRRSHDLQPQLGQISTPNRV